MNVSMSLILVAITVLVSYRAFNNQAFFFRLCHWPVKEHQQREYYRLLTHGFVHGSWLHLLINMFVLWQFGEIVEFYFTEFFGQQSGRLLFILVYLATIVFASVPTFLNKKDNSQYMSVGASGGVSGIVFIYILLMPWAMLYLYAIIPIPGIIAGILYLWYSSYASKNVRDRIDHEAHFYGALFGVFFTLLLKPSLANNFIDQLINNSPF